MKYFIVLVFVVAAVAGAPVEEESKKDKRGIFAAAPIALPAYHSAPIFSAHAAPIALPAPYFPHAAPYFPHAAPLALPAFHSAPIISAPIAHAPLILPAHYSLGHGYPYGKLLH